MKLNTFFLLNSLMLLSLMSHAADYDFNPPSILSIVKQAPDIKKLDEAGGFEEFKELIIKNYNSSKNFGILKDNMPPKMMSNGNSAPEPVTIEGQKVMATKEVNNSWLLVCPKDVKKRMDNRNFLKGSLEKTHSPLDQLVSARKAFSDKMAEVFNKVPADKIKEQRFIVATYQHACGEDFIKALQLQARYESAKIKADKFLDQIDSAFDFPTCQAAIEKDLQETYAASETNKTYIKELKKRLPEITKVAYETLNGTDANALKYFNSVRNEGFDVDLTEDVEELCSRMLIHYEKISYTPSTIAEKKTYKISFLRPKSTDLEKPDHILASKETTKPQISRTEETSSTKD